MELSKVEELNTTAKEFLLASQSFPSMSELQDVECVQPADGKEEEDKCNHFTIRGYVAGVRKRNAKFCWPLFVPQHETAEILSNSLPPLVISKFRRWSCLNCLRSISSSGDVIGNTEVMVENEVKASNSLIVANAGPNNLFSGFQQPSEDKILGERVTEANSSFNASHGESSQVPGQNKKEKELAVENVTKEGNQICKSDPFRPWENQVQSNNIAATEGESSQAGESLITKGKTVRRINLESTLLGNSGTMCAKPTGRHPTLANENAEVSDRTLTFQKASSNDDGNGLRAKCKRQVISNDMGQESSQVVALDMKLPKNALATIVTDAFNHELVDIDERSEKASDSNIRLSVDLSGNQKHETEVGSLNRKLNHKKSRKVRLLKDIMRCEESHISKKARILNVNTDSFKTKRDDDKLCGSELEAQFSGCKTLIVSRNSDATLTKALNISEADQSKEEEPSLMHWLKKISKKAISDKEYAEMKQEENKACISLGTSAEKGFRARGLEKNMMEKENKMPQEQSRASCRLPLENMSSENKLMKLVHNRNVPPKMRIKLPKSNYSLRDLELFHDQMPKFSEKKNKASQFGDRNPFQKHWSKKQTIKKRRRTKTCSTESADDIPMDIVELLAKNQHERHLACTKVAVDSMCEMPMVNESLTHEISSYTATGYESVMCNVLHKSQHMFDDTGEYVINAARGNREFECESEAVELPKQQKHYLHIDLNQQATEFQTTSDGRGYQHFRTQIPINNSNNIHYPQYLSWHKVDRQSIEFRQKEQAASGQSPSRNIFSRLSSPANDRTFGVNARNYNADNDYAKADSRVKNLVWNQRPLGVMTDEVVKPTSSHLLNVGGKAEQLTGKLNLTARPLMQGQDVCHLRSMGLTGSCSNETVSATHLLRLADQAALSGISMDCNHIGKIDEYYNVQSGGVLGSEGCLRYRETTKDPWRAGYSDQGQNLGFSCKPLRPVPRIGILGPFLQKEIMTQSNKCRTSLGIEPGYSSELPPPETTELEKTSHSCLFNQNSSIIKERTTKHVVPVETSHVCRCSSSIYEIDQAEIRKKERTAESVQYSGMTENCIVNRNPADFTLLDEDNVYLRGN